MRVYIHTPETTELKLVEVDGGIQLSQLIEAHAPGGDACAWLEDQEDALDPNGTLADAGIPDRGHIHISKACPRIAVRVRFAPEPKTKDFSPSTTINHVFQWATGKQGFSLTPAERAKHTLGLCDTTVEPDKSEHVGSLATPDCTLCLDLAPKERFEG